jgi:hypothetical protein
MTETTLVQLRKTIVIASLFVVLMALSAFFVAQTLARPISQPSHLYSVDTTTSGVQPDVPIKLRP